MKKATIIFLTVSTFLLSAAIPDQAMLKLFDAAHKNSNSKNTLLSPWGIQQCFGMVACGADKNSAAELQKFLGLDEKTAKKLHNARMSLAENRSFNSFNAVLVSKNETLQQNFVNTAAYLYGSRFFQLDFSRIPECTDILNGIVRKESRNMFDRVFKEDDLAGSPAAILMNVLYFKGAWQNSFKDFNTAKAPFKLADGNLFEADMMYQQAHVPYYNDGNIHGIILSYKDDAARFKMLFLMPVNENAPLSVVTEKLAVSGLKPVLSAAENKYPTDIRLPKLALKTDNDLKKLFESLGMKIIFSPATSDLNKMVSGHALYIEKTRQLIKLNMDEAGTEVAAVTYAIMVKNMAAPVKKINTFHADHPFAMILFDSETGAIILTAAVMNPVQ